MRIISALYFIIGVTTFLSFHPSQCAEASCNSLFASLPTIRENPNHRAPLIAIVDFVCKTDVVCTIDVSDGTNSWRQLASTPKRSHSIAVVGMRPSRKHAVKLEIRVAEGEGTTITELLTFTTPALPKDFPPLRTGFIKPDNPRSKVIMFAVNRWRHSEADINYGYVIAVDGSGEVVWFCKTDDRIADMRILRNGHLLYQTGSYCRACEVDVLGRIHRVWVSANTAVVSEFEIPVMLDSMHHDLLELPNGNFLTLATELVKFEKFPTSETKKNAPWKPAFVVCDLVAEFDPKTGVVQDRLRLAPLLDKERFGYLSLGKFWEVIYDPFIPEPSRDWSHANALLYLPKEDAIVVSFRHLDCVMMVDRKRREIRWILGDPTGWSLPWKKYLLKPIGELDWPYHQHSPQFTSHGNLVVYDNGNYRARPFDKATLASENQSRVVEFRIDDSAMTVEQVYEYRGSKDDEFYCPFYGEADWLPQSENMLVTNGGHIELRDGTPADIVPSERQWASIFEVNRMTRNKVFELRIDSGLNSELGWSVYRSISLPNLCDTLDLDASSHSNPPVNFERRPLIRRLAPLDTSSETGKSIASGSTATR